jgi:hypothetical protein
MQLTGVIQPAVFNTLLAEVEKASWIQEHIGYVVLGVILGPVLILTIASVIEFPKKSRIPELFLGSVFLLISGMVAGFAVIGYLLTFVVPQ